MTPCPTDDTLGALAHHALAADEVARVTAHLDDCETCRAIMLAVARAGGRPATPPTWHGAHGTPSLPLARGAARVAAPGTRLGRYRVRALLGAGGMGHVYEAYDAELDRAVALKILRPELASVGAVALAERLVRESRLMAKIAHPAVIAVHDVGRADDVVFVAMELVRGETLAAYLARARPGWRDAIELLARAGDGLAAAHDAGIVHRDFKPDNVLVELDDAKHGRRVVVTDFGIARAIGEQAPAGELAAEPTAIAEVRLTATGAVIGTPAYMAPEQFAGHRGQIDARADVFAFAVSAWEAVFGERPFGGTSVDEIRAAIARGPRPPRSGVPGALVRVLARGLAASPDARWPTMRAMLAALQRVRGRRRALVIAAAAMGLVGVGVAIAGAVAIAQPAHDDPCARELAALDHDYSAPARAALAAALAGDAKTHDAVLAKTDAFADTWRTTARATCHADREPAQNATTTACLDARQLELAGFVDDATRDGPKYAATLAGVLGEPERCVDPPPGVLAAHVPSDPAMRRRVTAVRYRIFEVEAARERADYPAALAAAPATVADAAALWPPLQAEALYVLGATQSQGGDSRTAAETLHRAAALAEAVHIDYVAANCWIQLVLTTTLDEGNPTRGLEYVNYADAALTRIGRPLDVEVLFQYAKGGALIEAGRKDEAEVALRRSVEIAKSSQPDYISTSIQGLGYFYEQVGRFDAAVDAYRDALARLPAEGGDPAAEEVFRERLAADLSNLGRNDAALIEARAAVAIAERIAGEDSQDKAVAHGILAQVLQGAGQFDAALAEARGASAEMKRVAGDHNQRYAEARQLEAQVLLQRRQYREADAMLERACDIMGFEVGETNERQAECWIARAMALSGLDRDREALALVEKALPLVIKTYGDDHPDVAMAWMTRGAARSKLGDHDGAVADLTRAREVFAKLPIEPGDAAECGWLLAKDLWPRDHARAVALLRDVQDEFARAAAVWGQERADAAAWLASDGHPPHGK